MWSGTNRGLDYFPHHWLGPQGNVISYSWTLSHCDPSNCTSVGTSICHLQGMARHGDNGSDSRVWGQGEVLAILNVSENSAFNPTADFNVRITTFSQKSVSKAKVLGYSPCFIFWFAGGTLESAGSPKPQGPWRSKLWLSDSEQAR